MHRNLRWFAAVGFGATALAVSACGSSSTSAGSSSAASSTPAASAKSSTTGKTVAFIPGATGVPFYEAMEAGAKAEATKLGYGFTYQGAADFTPSAQVPVVNSVCATKPAILLIAPTDPVALRPAIQTCLSDGIKVVTVDTTLSNTQGIVSQISSNNLQGGEAAAKLIATALHGKGEVGVMSLSPTASTQVLRVQGLKKGLGAYSGIKVVSVQYTAQAPSASETVAQAMLSANPGLGAIFGAAEPNGEGAAQVAGRTGHKVAIVAYDASPPEVALLKSGKLAGLVVQPPAEEGQLGVEYGNDAIKGDASAIKKSVLLPNVVATSADANSPAIEKSYY